MRVARLDAVVELVGERALELLDDADQVDARAGARVRGEEARDLVEILDVVGELVEAVKGILRKEASDRLRADRRFCPVADEPLTGRGLSPRYGDCRGSARNTFLQMISLACDRTGLPFQRNFHNNRRELRELALEHA